MTERKLTYRIIDSNNECNFDIKCAEYKPIELERAHVFCDVEIISNLNGFAYLPKEGTILKSLTVSIYSCTLLEL